jgi:hypothetical protein
VRRAEGKPASVDEFVFATDSGRPRDKDSVRERVLVPIVHRVALTSSNVALWPDLVPCSRRLVYRLGHALGHGGRPTEAGNARTVKESLQIGMGTAGLEPATSRV